MIIRYSRRRSEGSQRRSNRLGFLIFLASFSFATLHGADRPPISPLANADENYTALRSLPLTETYAVADLTLKRDIGILRLLKGTVTFGQPVLGKVTLAVFSGEGEFVFEPSVPWEVLNLVLHTGEKSVREPLAGAVIWFTDKTQAEIQQQAQSAAPDTRAVELLNKFRSRLRKRVENPGTRLEALFAGADMDNVEADTLADLYNPARAGAFSAYLSGRKHDDLRFFVRPRGALSQVLSPEEVALIHYAPDAQDGGIWYLSHHEDELASGKFRSDEQKSPIDALHYKIDTTIQKNKTLAASCEFTFAALESGERVIRFGLLPDLRVSSVKSGAAEIAFIQEPKDQDASFYVILPEPTIQGQNYTLQIDYAGDEVIRSEGGGNFAVGARTSWYPSIASFNDRATFELTYRYPKEFTLVSVGNLAGEQQEKDFTVSRWKSEVPLAVAGFNYGRFSKKEVFDEASRYQIEGYAASQVPDFLRNAELGNFDPRSAPADPRGPTGNLSPKRLLERTLGEAQLSMRLFTKYYGELPFGRLALTQQPQFNFGQSWPALIYLPVSAYLDSTQRWAILGSSAFAFADFIQEVTPHEVAHQWWGHLVGWASYHDQWLSEGFADFSAGLFLQVAEKNPQVYLEFIEKWRKAILERNRYGLRPNDVGPIWMGSRLITQNTAEAYRKLIYPKGGYVLHMLRWMMFDQQTGDELFSAMMRDFVKTHYNKNASTESFKAVVERHMTQAMNFEGQGRMDWFFRQWVYGTEVPSYELRYKLTPEGGKTILEATVTQSGVSEGFCMPVPLYVEAGGRLMKLGSQGLKGNLTSGVIRVPLNFRPDRVLINANHDILADAVVVKPL
jgi:hypothetical protein